MGIPRGRGGEKARSLGAALMSERKRITDGRWTGQRGGGTSKKVF